MLASTSQFPVGMYQNRLGYQNSSAAVGCSAPRSRIFAPGVPRDIHTRHIAKIIGAQTQLLIGRLLMTSASLQANVGGYLRCVPAAHDEDGYAAVSIWCDEEAG